jgi:hypothetical protein
LVVDHEDAAELLERAWRDAENPSIVPGPDLKQRIETVMAAKALAKGFKYMLVTGILGKATEPSVHPRSIQAGSSLPGAYDARSLCHKVVVRFEKTKGNLFGLSNEPFLIKSLRHPEHDKTNPQLKKKDTAAALHDALEMINTTSEAEVYAALVHVLRLGRLNSASAVRTTPAAHDDLKVSISFVSRFLEKTDGGARLVAVWAALLKLSDDRADVDVKAYNPNQSDKFSGTIGDVEVFEKGELVSASECKHRPVNIDDVEHGLAKNLSGAEYIFVLASGFAVDMEKPVKDRIAHAAGELNVSIVEEKEFPTILKLLGERRKKLGPLVVKFLTEMREFTCADEAAALWTDLLEE